MFDDINRYHIGKFEAECHQPTHFLPRSANPANIHSLTRDRLMGPYEQVF